VNPAVATVSAQTFEIPNSAWFFDPDENIDITVAPIDFSQLRSLGLSPSFFADYEMAADKKKMNEIGVSDGDGVFILGFPALITGEERNYVVVRHGIISRISDALGMRNNTFLLDSFVFPGNSGGPVVLEPNIIGIENTKTNRRAYLIGVVRAYLPYQDTAVSQQTGEKRIVFEENSGLTVVIPIDYIENTIWKYLYGRAGLPPSPL
jgi:hypothetical protein